MLSAAEEDVQEITGSLATKALGESHGSNK